MIDSNDVKLPGVQFQLQADKQIRWYSVLKSLQSLKIKKTYYMQPFYS